MEGVVGVSGGGGMVRARRVRRTGQGGEVESRLEGREGEPFTLELPGVGGEPVPARGRLRALPRGEECVDLGVLSGTVGDVSGRVVRSPWSELVGVRSNSEKVRVKGCRCVG